MEQVDSPCQDDNQFVKECTDQCDYDLCNEDNNVELLFSKMDSNYPDWPHDLFCYHYDSTNDPGYQVGHAPTGTPAKCPHFANTACFQSGTNDSFIRGCSPIVRVNTVILESNSWIV